ncbi:Retinoic acid early-inducible protein 1-alpha [Microtus ochrogaster]|uniref:Retinoic acid early-inducible protein 1-alpha n=1 Tax=Microtus ochrogaster TaxID=79684 RepID=A0A8J6GDR0_MICOH|nr:Retinoic acid early-inducible protein 1-alpha [Microtus ochrogaster]
MQRQRRGKNVVHQLSVTLEDLYNGATRKLALQKNVISDKCEGRGDLITKLAAHDMARNAAAQNYPSTKAPCFWILLICLWSMIPMGDTHSLSCDIIVKARTTPGQSWCEGLCSVDGEPFLQYDNDNKATPLGDLGKATDATKVWTDMTQRLKYLGQDLRKMLADTEKEITKISGQPNLQATMLSQYEQEQIVDASWRFNISGKYSFLLDTVNMNWIPSDDEVGGIMNKWKDEKQLIEDLKIISTGDCSYWLKELLKHQKEKPTSPAAVPDVVQPLSLSIYALLIIITCLFLILL